MHEGAPSAALAKMKKRCINQAGYPNVQGEEGEVPSMEHRPGDPSTAGKRCRRCTDTLQELCLLRSVLFILCQREPPRVFKERHEMMESMIGEGSSGCRTYNDYDLFQMVSSETVLVKANTPSSCVLGRFGSHTQHPPPKLTSYTHTQDVLKYQCVLK